ncbi:MAG: hypothetical protein HXY40_19395, partial [Chloroflexi bacterium]|nr:hypothetical protein [Chloroflexota bacterium]
MSDKFNDDFSWLTDPDDPENKDQPSPDSDDLAWQQGGQRPSGESGGSLGFTGQLSWKQDAGDESAPGDDEQGFDWQEDEGENQPYKPSRTGLTGQLSWQRENAPQKSSEDWLNDLASVMGKMSDTQDDDDSGAGDTPAAAADMPDWLRGAAPPAAPGRAPQPPPPAAE